MSKQYIRISLPVKQVLDHSANTSKIIQSLNFSKRSPVDLKFFINAPDQQNFYAAYDIAKKNNHRTIFQSFPLFLEEIQQKFANQTNITIKNDYFLLFDVFSAETQAQRFTAPGQNFTLGLDWTGNKNTNEYQKSKTSNTQVKNCSDIAILYAQVHKTTQEVLKKQQDHPHENFTIDFRAIYTDDEKRQKLQTFYEKNPQLIPKNVSVNFSYFDSNSNTFINHWVTGTGKVNQDYLCTLKLINHELISDSPHHAEFYLAWLVDNPEIADQIKRFELSDQTAINAELESLKKNKNLPSINKLIYLIKTAEFKKQLIDLQTKIALNFPSISKINFSTMQLDKWIHYEFLIKLMELIQEILAILNENLALRDYLYTLNQVIQFIVNNPLGVGSFNSLYEKIILHLQLCKMPYMLQEIKQNLANNSNDQLMSAMNKLENAVLLDIKDLSDEFNAEPSENCKEKITSIFEALVVTKTFVHNVTLKTNSQSMLQEEFLDYKNSMQILATKNQTQTIDKIYQFGLLVASVSLTFLISATVGSVVGGGVGFVAGSFIPGLGNIVGTVGGLILGGLASGLAGAAIKTKQQLNQFGVFAETAHQKNMNQVVNAMKDFGLHTKTNFSKF